MTQEKCINMSTHKKQFTFLFHNLLFSQYSRIHNFFSDIICCCYKLFSTHGIFRNCQFYDGGFGCFVSYLFMSRSYCLYIYIYIYMHIYIYIYIYMEKERERWTNWYIYIYVIIIIIMSHFQQGSPWPSHATRPNRPSFPAGLYPLWVQSCCI